MKASPFPRIAIPFSFPIHWLLAILAIPGPSLVNAEAGRASGQVYRNSDFGFSFTVPEGWFCRETNYPAFHYYDVFLTINNRRPDLAVQTKWVTQNYRDFNPTTTLSQMLPGEVHVTVGSMEGPFDRRMTTDSVGQDLSPLWATNRISLTYETNLSQLTLRFFKRGRQWQISAYLREPIAQANRERVISMLKSFRFLDAPVNDPGWAESLAWKELPESIRGQPFPCWPAVRYVGQAPGNAGWSVRVDKAPTGYTVQFVVAQAGTWRYLVLTNGTVRLMKE